MNLPEQLPREAIIDCIAESEARIIDRDRVDSSLFDVLHGARRYSPVDICVRAARLPLSDIPSSGVTRSIQAKCCRLLRNAGFRIVPKLGTIPFEVGATYTRKTIGEHLGIESDTTKGDWATGYHLHRDEAVGINGWWFLFPTVGNASRTGHQYGNTWIDDHHLQWEGKTTSRLGQSQIDSLIGGDNLVLLFTREESRAPFQYHGLVIPTVVADTTPVQVTWLVGNESGTESDYDLPASDDTGDSYQPKPGDRREKILREINMRRGQQQFRASLLRACKGRCVVTGCQIQGLLEAAHIHPYRGINDNHASNGLLLRCDIHTLFDINLLGISPDDHSVHIHPDARQPPYDDLHGKTLPDLALSYQALFHRWRLFCESS